MCSTSTRTYTCAQRKFFAHGRKFNPLSIVLARVGGEGTMAATLARRLLSSWRPVQIRTLESPSSIPFTTSVHCGAPVPQEMNRGSALCRLFSNLSLSSTAGVCRSRYTHGPIVPVRTLVKSSKLGKMKTVKAVAKRFRVTGSGKFKFWPPGNVHNLMSKSHDQKCRVRKPRYANKTQTKMLRKMLSGRYS